MSMVRSRIAISLDGFAAGPNQSEEQPLGDGGEQLHDWALKLAAWRRPHGREGGEVNESSRVLEAHDGNLGATVMGRNMFGGGPGPWGEAPWEGWWGDDPPFHHPVFVLTHHPREPLAKEGGTSFTFVTEGIDAALAQAKEAADRGDVNIAGGAQTIQQFLAAGAIEELLLHVVPIVLGGGERLLDNLGDDPPRFEIAEVVDAPEVTHLRYRVLRDGQA